MIANPSHPSDLERIAAAMAFIAERLPDQPSLREVADHVHLSPFHFQRIFSRRAGITPKRFQQALTLERGKALLTDTTSLLDVSESMGLSSTSRLHDHFVRLDAVTPGEYRARGRHLTIQYGTQQTPFGRVFVAQTPRGVCRLAFLDGADDTEMDALHRTWPLATLVRDDAAASDIARGMFHDAMQAQKPLSLHVSGTNFQIAVWRALLRIPPGMRVSYADVAQALGKPGSVRAVGNAVAANPVAFHIPCHRVIHKSGALGAYRWGSARKMMIQAWEHARAQV